MYACDHCLAEISEKDAIFEEREHSKHVFCCVGCQGIYHLIQGSGLAEFYERRAGWRPGPPDKADISLALFANLTEHADYENQIDIYISGIRCASCVWLIEHFLAGLEGVSSVRVNYVTHRLRIRWESKRTDLEAILNGITSLGYTPRPYTLSIYDELFKRERKDLLIRLGTASFFSIQIMMYTIALYAGYFQGIDPFYKKIFQLITWLLATPVMFYAGFPFIKNAFVGMRNRVANMDALVFIGSFSSYTYSIFMIFRNGEVYFDTSSMIITLILVGRLIETGMKGKASEAISLLMNLQPKEARLVKTVEGHTETISAYISTLKEGDMIEVIPGETIPLDCEVVGGDSEVDESMLTGESVSVKKTKGADVFAGTTNLNGSLILIVKRTGNSTVLSGIISAVEEAQTRKAPIQRVADRVVIWFVPAILAVSVLTFIFWYKNGSSVTHALMNAVSVLVIACPCALGLATPLAILTGSAVLLRKGILVKGGDVLEAVARTDLVIFDKTGTLTSGKPSLVNILSYGAERKEIERLAATLERSSEHIIARTIYSGISDKDIYPVKRFRAHPGMGVEGIIKDKRAVAGNIEFLRYAGIVITDEQIEQFNTSSSQGMTVIGLGMDDKLMGWIIIADALRPEAKDAIKGIRKSGCEIGMLTGDNSSVARRVAEEAGISVSNSSNTPYVFSGITPLQKAEKIADFRKADYRVAMVGDGINDAPALIEADVGISMGKATDIAIRSSDIVLMRNNLGLIPPLIRISRRTLSAIRQNLFWAFSYNIIAIPLAVSGEIHPIISAALMALSSLVVLGNSLFLNMREYD